ncbi:UNVERIFIED_CONTAM: IS5 family transposase [Kocuria sp. CPCC 205316]|uniref:IS5 family transposase n=1 Tax=Kocuria TaxID=57493 RepID=UPI0036D7A923
MPAVRSCVIEPIWDQFQVQIPPMVDEHPLACHRPRNSDRAAFDKLVQVLVLEADYDKIADTTCSATTIRRRRDEWINAGAFEELEQLCLDGYEKMVSLHLVTLAVDGCITKAPCGGEVAGRSPVDRGKQGTKRSLLVDGAGTPLGAVVAAANRHDSPLLRPTLETLSRFGFDLPQWITVHLDAGYDSKGTRALLAELGGEARSAIKGVPAPIQNTARWGVERTNSWHNRGFKKLAICAERRTGVIEAFIALAIAVIITRRLIRQAWTRHRWDTRPTRRP